MTKLSAAKLLVWWVACSGTTIWGLWGAPLVFVTVALGAAAAFTVALLRWDAHRTGVRLVVYVTAVLDQSGTRNHVGVVAAAARPPPAQGDSDRAGPALDDGRRRGGSGDVPAGAGMGGHRPAPPVCPATPPAAVASGRSGRLRRGDLPSGITDKAWAGGQDLFGITPSHYPTAGGGFGAWALETATGGLAGAVEEPVFVGLLVLLWPALRARTFVPLALLSGVARASIHLYYAAGTAHVGIAVALIVLWCAAWSSASLMLIYRTRMLWPVIVAHGLNNYVATLNGPFTADVTPLHVAAVGAPLITILAIGGVAIIYGVPRGVDSLSGAITRRWPNLDRKPQLLDT